MKRRILLLALLSLACATVLSAQSETDSVKKRPPTPKLTTVVLTIDYGDGAQKRFPTIPWKKGFTVLDALEWAKKHPRGIELQRRGKEATTLVLAIDDLENSGASKKNWIFRVNGKLGDRSCGVFPVRPADRILWRFERYQ